MKTMLNFVVSLSLTVTPSLAHAASIDDDGSHIVAKSGAFAGARVRLRLGGAKGDRAQIGMTVAPMRAAQRSDGARALQIGDGLAAGFDGRGKAALTFAGEPIGRRFGASEGKRRGVPTWVLITGGVVIVLGIGAAVFIDKLEDASD